MTSQLTVEQPAVEMPPAEQLTLALLPKDVLVTVLQYLSVDDLLAFRFVCKRLGGLVLDPDVWRHRRISYESRSGPCICSVLALAPCLKSVQFSKNVHTYAFIGTRCAVRELNLYFGKRTRWVVAGMALRNQEALGRLRRVELCCGDYFDACYSEDGELFLKTLATCSGLESLVISDGLPLPLKPILRVTSSPSLRYFRCEVTRCTVSFVNAVLTAHAATLEVVDLSTSSAYGKEGSLLGFESEAARQRAVKAVGGPLACMPKLRKLASKVFAGMGDLAAPNVLEDVTFFVDDHDHNDGTSAKGAAELLRRAAHLRSVTVDSRYSGRDDFEVLAKALAESELPLVERLTIIGLPAGAVHLRLLVLSQLAGLRQLILSGEALDNPFTQRMLLLGITPATAPSLRYLQLQPEELPECSHAWLHRDGVKTVLAENPSLHVHLRGCEACNNCRVCTLECHAQLAEQRISWLCFFSHDPEKCPSPEDHVHVDGHTDQWIHAPDRPDTGFW